MTGLEIIKEKLAAAKSIEFVEPFTAYNKAKEALELARKENLHLEEADALYWMAHACRVMSDYKNGLDHVLTAFEVYKAIGNRLGIVNASNLAGIIYFYFGDFASALEYFLASKDQITEDMSPDRRIALENNIGEVYREAGQYKEALRHYTMALREAEDNSLVKSSTSVYNNISDVHKAMKDWPQAMTAAKLAYEGAFEVNDVIGQAEAEFKLGYLFMIEGSHTTAESYYFSSLTKLNRINNKFYLIQLLLNMSELSLIKGENPLNYLNEALETALGLKLNSKVVEIYKRLSDYYESIHDYKSALAYHKNFYLVAKEIEADILSEKLELMLVEINHSKEQHESERLKSLSEKLKRDILTSNNELQRIRNENASLVKENSMDELTQTYNRRGIYQMFSEVLDANRGDLSVVYIIDIDHFKTYNDAWGHIQGDLCLKKVVEALSTIKGNNGFLGRFGGEEFIMHFNVENFDQAAAIGEEIRTAVFNLKMPYSKSDLEHYLSISVGGIVGVMHNEKIRQWIDMADHQLYNAKENGRNQVKIKMN